MTHQPINQWTINDQILIRGSQDKRLGFLKTIYVYSSQKKILKTMVSPGKKIIYHRAT